MGQWERKRDSIYREVSVLWVDTEILIGILYLGFSAAFDKVPYFLMNKMETWGEAG